MWFVISLLLFAAAVFFWKLGDRRRNAVAPAALTNAGVRHVIALTNPLVLTASIPASAPASASALGQPVAIPTGSMLVQTNPFPFRLSNTEKKLAELLHDNRAVLLRNAFYDTANPARPEIPAHLRAPGDPGSYVVQAREAITDLFRRRVQQTGAEIISYIPNNAVLVRATPAQMRQLAASPQTQAVLPFEPYYKLDGLLLPLAVNRQLSPYEKLNVVSFPGQTARARARIEAIGGAVFGEPERTPMGENLVATVPADALATLAQIPEVQIVSARSERRLLNDLARTQVKISQNTTSGPPASHYPDPIAATPLTGDNVLVGVADSGADATHPDLAGRVSGGGPDPSGHGTHVIGTILGNGAQSATVGGDGTNSAAQGSRQGAWFTGMAPQAQGMMHSYNLPDFTKQQLAASSNAVIVNNSWAYFANDYDIFAASYDAAVRDSLPFLPGEQQITYVFAAGNAGGGAGNGLGGNPGSVLSPATAKNVITVGGTELYRHITNEVTIITTNSTNVSLPWFPETSSFDQVAGFSSRGNVGQGIEGPFGRFKPDVIAPGAMLVSCRSVDYTNPPNTLSVSANTYNSLVVDRGRTNYYSIGIPANCIRADIFVRPPNANPTTSNSPVNFPLWLDAELDNFPAAPAIGTNSITLVTNGAPVALAAGTLFYSVGNPWTNIISYDLVVVLTMTNNVGDFYQVLDALNNSLGGSYRYEEGTSMSAAVVSGFLALIQEFFAKNLATTNSPALNKALLINGARSVGIQYNLQTRTTANHQGWGMVNISNTIPSRFNPAAATSPLRYYEQDSTNALATGDNHVYTITVPPEAQSSPLRISLVWTDPAANPVSSVKLVNDLDLFVDGPGITFSGSNTLTRTLRWLGNNFTLSSDFTAPIQLADTNGVPVPDTNITQSVELIRDTVNNVENVFIAPPLGGTYTVVVRGHRVNVNAVNSHTNGVVQDYALVISTGDIATNTTGIQTTGPVITNNPAPFVIPMQTPGQTNGVALLNQRVGASSALLTGTNGMTNQWTFFTFTNLDDVNFQYVAIVTFLPPNIGFLQPNFANPATPRYREGDIDLYVTRTSVDPLADALTLLDDATIDLADKSRGRTGTEIITYTNAQPGEVFFIGVKAEDQQSSTFGIFAVSSDVPFSNRDASNNIHVLFFPTPALIPDGSPDDPGGVIMMGICTEPDVVQRVIVTNTVTHEDAGDLIGILSHADSTSAAGQDAFATLFNHRWWTETETSVYDDSGLNDVTNSITSDGPGTLRAFVGQQAVGLWTFTVVDNALFHTGVVNSLEMVIEPASTNDTNLVNITRIVPPQSWLYAPANVPFDAVSMEVCVSDNTLPVELYIRRLDFPTRLDFDYATNVPVGGLCMTIGLGDTPPLVPGSRYYIGVYNPDPVSSTRVTLRVNVARSPLPGPYLTFTQTNAIAILDDAVTIEPTNSFLLVTNVGRVADVRVGIRVDHERASDLVFHLVSPTGTRLLLAENRGRTNLLGYGAGRLETSNVIYTYFTENTNLTVTPIKFAAPPYTNAPNPFSGRVVYESFENFPGGDSYPISHNGWVLEYGNWDTINVGTNPAPPYYTNTVDTGFRCIELNGDAPASLYTNISLTLGQKYKLSFAFSHRFIDPLPGLGEVEVEGVFKIPFTTSPGVWTNTLTNFTATAPSTRLHIRDLGGASAARIDTILLEKDVTSSSDVTSWFLPEESLHPFYGEDAAGRWALEVWDNRIGGVTTNPFVLTWQLQIAFPYTNPPVITLTNRVGYTNVLYTNNALYFAVDVPCTAGWVTNTLTCLTTPSAGVNLIVNPFFAPTNGPLDQLLLSNVTATSSYTLDIGPPPLGNSRRYYLAVTNTDPAALSNVFSLRIDAVCRPPDIVLTNGICFNTTNDVGARRDFTFPVTNTALQAVFEVVGMDGDVDLYLRADVPPVPGSVGTTNSSNPGTADEAILKTRPTLTNANNGGSRIWHLAVMNVDTKPVSYCVRVRTIHEADVTRIDQNVYYSNLVAEAGSTNYYVVNLGPLPTSGTLDRADFKLLNILTNADVDLYVSRLLPLPVPGASDFSSINPGQTDELVTVDTNTIPIIGPGDWYFTVVNTNLLAAGGYDLWVETTTKSLAGLSLSAGASSFSGGAMTLKWAAQAGQQYEVQFTESLPANWQPLGPPVTSTNGTFSFTDTTGGGTNVQRFYRIKRVQ